MKKITRSFSAIVSIRIEIVSEDRDEQAQLRAEILLRAPRIQLNSVVDAKVVGWRPGKVWKEGQWTR